MYAHTHVAYTHNHIPPRPGAMAVIVQQMVPAELAGMLLAAPVSGDADCIVIEGTG